MLGWSLLSKQWMHRHQKNLDGLYLDFVTRLIESIKSKFKGNHLKYTICKHFKSVNSHKNDIRSKGTAY